MKSTFYSFTKSLIGILCGIVLMLTYGCGSSSGQDDGILEDDSSSGDAPSSDEITNPGSISGTVIVDDETAISTSFKKVRITDKSVSSLKVSVEGYPSLFAATDNEGNFEITDVPDGQYCISAFAENNEDVLYAFRKCNITVSAARTDVGSIPLEETGSLTGLVTLEGGNNHLGITIYAAGTSFSAFSGETGGYSISNIPAGIYTIVLSKDGYVTQAFSNIAIEAGLSTTLNDVVLKATLETAQACADGSLLKIFETSQSATEITEGESVTLSIQACSSTGSTISYSWSFEHDPDEADSYSYEEMYAGVPFETTGNSLIIQSNSSNGSTTMHITVNAHIEPNIDDVYVFHVMVKNVNFLAQQSVYDSYTNYTADGEAIAQYGNSLLLLFKESSQPYTGIIEVVDVSNPEAPIYQGAFETMSWPSSLIVSGDRLYSLGCTTSGSSVKNVEHLLIYDLSTELTNPTILFKGALNQNPPCGGFLAINDTGDVLYYYHTLYESSKSYAGKGSFIDIYDVTDPTVPSLKSSITISNNTSSTRPMHYFNNHLFFENLLSTDDDLAILDVSNPTAPALLNPFVVWEGDGDLGGLVQHPNLPHLFFIATEFFAENTSGYRLDIVDVSDPSQIQHVASHPDFHYDTLHQFTITASQYIFGGYYYSYLLHAYDARDLEAIVHAGDIQLIDNPVFEPETNNYYYDSESVKIKHLLSDTNSLYLLTENTLHIFDLSTLPQ